MFDNSGKSALSRRVFVGQLAAGAAVTLAAGAGTARALTRREASSGAARSQDLTGNPPLDVAVDHPHDVVEGADPGGTPPMELLRPLTIGSSVAGGWRVAELSGVRNGSCVLTLQNEKGRTHRVHVCRNDGRPQGLIHTERLDLFVMNGGQGDLPTEEGLAQAVAEVAHVLAANEEERRHEPVMASLMSQAERVQRFAGAAGLR